MSGAAIPAAGVGELAADLVVGKKFAALAAVDALSLPEEVLKAAGTTLGRCRAVLRRIRDAVKKGRQVARIRRSKISEILGCHEYTVQRALNALRIAGVLTWKRTGRSSEYTVHAAALVSASGDAVDQAAESGRRTLAGEPAPAVKPAAARPGISNNEQKRRDKRRFARQQRALELTDRERPSEPEPPAGPGLTPEQRAEAERLRAKHLASRGDPPGPRPPRRALSEDTDA